MELVEKGVTRLLMSLLGVVVWKGGGGNGLRMGCVDVERGGHKRGTEELGGDRCVKALVSKDLKETEKAVVVAVRGGREGCQ